MAKMVLPRVHVMVLCDDVEPSTAEEDVFDLRGVRTYIAAPAFPYTHPQLAVYLQMTGHPGTATGRAVVSSAETDQVVYETEDDPIQFHGPLNFVSVRWWVQNCRFPEAGLYYVQVYFDDKLVQERALFLVQTESATGNGQQAG